MRDPDVTAIFHGLGHGALAVVALCFGVVALHAVTAWRFAPARGALGALGNALRVWRRAAADREPGTGLLAALTSLVPPAVAAAAIGVAPASPTGNTVVVAITLPIVLAPVLGALGGGSAARARLSLDNALVRSARLGVLLTAAVLAAGTPWLPILGLCVVVALLRLHHPGIAGFKPAADTAVGDGTRLALFAGERAVVLVLVALVATSTIAFVAGIDGGAPWLRTAIAVAVGTGVARVVVAAIVAVIVVWAAIRLVERLGPLTMQGLGSRGPLLLLALAAVARAAS